MPPWAESPHDQAGIGRRHGPDREIEALLDQIDQPLPRGHRDRSVRIEAEIFRYDRSDEAHDMAAAIEPQRAARRRMQRLGDPVGILQLAEDLHAAFVIGLADLGQPDLARRPVQQPRAEPVFERLDMVADHGHRHVQPRAAAEKPPLSTTRTKTSKLVSRSIIRSHWIILSNLPRLSHRGRNRILSSSERMRDGEGHAEVTQDAVAGSSTGGFLSRKTLKRAVSALALAAASRPPPGTATTIGKSAVSAIDGRRLCQCRLHTVAPKVSATSPRCWSKTIRRSRPPDPGTDRRS